MVTKSIPVDLLISYNARFLQRTLSTLVHSYNAPMVAKMCRGCWCRLATAFTAHMNGMLIAFDPSNAILVLLRKETRASLCKCANSPEPSLPANDILVFIALFSDYMAHVSLGNCADSPVIAQYWC